MPRESPLPDPRSSRSSFAIGAPSLAWPPLTSTPTCAPCRRESFNFPPSFPISHPRGHSHVSPGPRISSRHRRSCSGSSAGRP